VVATGAPDGLVMIKLDVDGRLWRLPAGELSPDPCAAGHRDKAQLGPLFGVLIDLRGAR
jgi:hypothetical protein